MRQIIVLKAARLSSLDLSLAPLPNRYEVGHFPTLDEPVPPTNPAFNKVFHRSTLVGLEDFLAEANRYRCHFHKFVVADEFNGLLQVQKARGNQANGFVGG
jgi:hypothetical protein